MKLLVRTFDQSHTLEADMSNEHTNPHMRAIKMLNTKIAGDWMWLTDTIAVPLAAINSITILEDN